MTKFKKSPTYPEVMEWSTYMTTIKGLGTHYLRKPITSEPLEIHLKLNATQFWTQFGLETQMKQTGIKQDTPQK